jgi:hypothetical protein
LRHAAGCMHLLVPPSRSSPACTAKQELMCVSGGRQQSLLCPPSRFPAHPSTHCIAHPSTHSSASTASAFLGSWGDKQTEQLQSQCAASSGRLGNSSRCMQGGSKLGLLLHSCKQGVCTNSKDITAADCRRGQHRPTALTYSAVANCTVFPPLSCKWSAQDNCNFYTSTAATKPAVACCCLTRACQRTQLPHSLYTHALLRLPREQQDSTPHRPLLTRTSSC